MGSGPARALIRAEELYDDLGWDERASAAVLCLETREPPPAAVADFVAERAGVPPSALTLADGADGEHHRQRADRGARRRDRAAQAPRARLRRAARRRGLRQLPAAAGGGRRHGGARAHQRRRALRRPGPAHRGRRRRRAARARRAPPRLGLLGLRRAVRQGVQGRRVRLLQDRPAALQPGADQAHERRAAGAASRPARSTSRCWSARSGAEGRDPGLDRRLARAAADRRPRGARPRASPGAGDAHARAHRRRRHACAAASSGSTAATP